MRRFRRGRGRGKQRTREWIAATTSPTEVYEEPGALILAPNQFTSSWILHPGDSTDFFDEPTLVRTLVHLSYLTDVSASVVSTGTWNDSIWIGFVIWRSDIAGPNDLLIAANGSRDWIWWFQGYTYKLAVGQFIVQGGGTANPGQGNMFDLKGKRKIPNGSGIAFCAQTPATNDAEIEFAISTRMLLLHG